MIPKVVKKITKKPLINKPLSKKKENVTLRNLMAIKLVEKGGSKGAALRAAGYSEAVAKNPHKIFNKPGVKKIVDKHISALEKERDAALALMSKKRSSASYAVLSMSIRSLNHDIQLLGGKATERVDIPISEEERERLNKLIFKNSSEN